MHTCVGGREEKHQPSRMFLVCQTQCQPGGVHSCPPGTAAQWQGQDPQPPLAFGMWRVPNGTPANGHSGGWDVVLCQWDSDSPALGDPLWSTRKALGEHPQAGHTGRTLLNPFQRGHRSHWKMDHELSFLTASGKINVLTLRVSFFQWTFPCWAGISISCCHRADSCSLWDPSFLALGMMNLTF